MNVCAVLLLLGVSLTENIKVRASSVELFRDHFAGEQLNREKWNAADRRSAVNEELEYYSPANLQVANGSLALVAKQERRGGANYTSGRVDTKGLFDFTYGNVEIRAKLPKGKGLWASLWLEHYQCAAAVPCTQWPPAISILDFRGDQTHTIPATLYYKDAADHVQSSGKVLNAADDLSDDFHVYRLQWSPNKLAWSVDGQPAFFVIDDPQKIPAQRLQLVMNVAVGGMFPGSPDDTTEFPAAMLVDYVKVTREDSSSAGHTIRNSFIFAWICVFILTKVV
ncbi:beta-glucanase-like [Paramacrobiotus metropolitanus]|uniref:beta-glucanase-like n=1 Tax=Paramacrobiotus metropolitanus TaxID=2943436 RepID=UPI0024460045|nr:beta-glucanase-like [Paramacrobiotus metropolitanus]